MKTLLNQCDEEEILPRLSAVRPESARRWGTMSAHQMICHLCDGYKLYMGLITAAPPGFPYPSKALKWIAVWAPLPWPGGIKTVRELAQQLTGTPSSEFAQDQAKLTEVLDRLTRTPRDFQWPAHPFMGRMSEREWMRLSYLHADHHLRQFGA